MISPATGTLLIADPFLKDPSFLRTVVLLCEHRQEGSFGFVLNKKTAHSLDELIADFEGFTLPVYFGGPVQTDSIHFVHQYPDLIGDCTKVNDDIYWGGNFETVKALIQAKRINTARIKFFLGYSGWGDGQLKTEMNEKSWLTVQATKNLVFNTTPADVWKNSLQHLGGEYTQLINYPADPQLN